MVWYSYKTGFRTGTRVRIIKQHKYKSTNLVGKLGTVKSGYGTEVSVMIDGMLNSYSVAGHFYFKPSELEIVDECINDVEENTNMPNITNYLNAVKIQYIDNIAPSGYIYANFYPFVEVGDLVVIKSGNHGIGLARVTEILDGNDYEISTREVVAKIDTRDYDERVANRAKAAEIMEKMKERAKKLQDIALYQMLAKDDPEMMALLESYNSLPRI